MTAKDFIVGFCIGAAVGAATGLILAPESGRDTRQAVGGAAVAVRNRAAGYAGSVKDRVRPTAGGIRPSM